MDGNRKYTCFTILSSISIFAVAVVPVNSIHANPFIYAWRFQALINVWEMQLSVLMNTWPNNFKVIWIFKNTNQFDNFLHWILLYKRKYIHSLDPHIFLHSYMAYLNIHWYLEARVEGRIKLISYHPLGLIACLQVSSILISQEHDQNFRQNYVFHAQNYCI